MAVFLSMHPVWSLEHPAWLFSLLPPMLFLHQFGEFALPGGFPRWWNEVQWRSTDPEFPFSKRLARQVNLGPIVVAVYAAAVLNEHAIWFGFFVVSMMFVNAWYHLSHWYADGRYAPGSLTALGVISPAFFVAVWRYVYTGLLPWPVAAAVFLMAFIPNAAGFAIMRKRLAARVRPPSNAQMDPTRR